MSHLSPNAETVTHWVRYVLAVCCAIVLVGSQAAQAQHAMGAVLDDAAYEEEPLAAPLTRGSYRGMPASVSLRRFTPTPGDQGQQGSCVGWATAYAARTMSEALMEEIDSRYRIDDTRFSPAYVYNQIKDGSCMAGSLIRDAMQVIERQGVARLDDYPYDDGTCSRPITASDRQNAAPFKIDDYKRLYGYDAQSKHVAVKRSLAEGHPVVFGMMTPRSFSDAGVRWRPEPGDYSAGNLGGHAMTVIGYDDSRYGGAFEVINSWGTDWGDGGYTWITYDDFDHFVKLGYQIVLHPPTPPAQVDLAGELTFHHVSGRTMEAERAGGHYRLRDPWPSGTRFRVEVANTHAAYVYALGGDLTHRYVPLFPYEDTMSSHVGANAALSMPGPTERFFTRMDDTEGTDFYVVLYAREPLDVDRIARSMTNGQGSTMERLHAALGRDRVADDDIALRDDRIAFEAKSRDRVVVPLVVEIEHVAVREQVEQDAPQIALTAPRRSVLQTVADGEEVIPVRDGTVTLEGVAQDESAIQRVTVSPATSVRYSSQGGFRAVVSAPAAGSQSVTVTATDVHGNTSTTTYRLRRMR